MAVIARATTATACLSPLTGQQHAGTAPDFAASFGKAVIAATAAAATVAKFTSIFVSRICSVELGNIHRADSNVGRLVVEEGAGGGAAAIAPAAAPHLPAALAALQVGVLPAARGGGGQPCLSLGRGRTVI
jgi:hypothetical protein